MRMKFSLQRFVGFLCITALAVISVLSFSQASQVYASTTAKLGIKTANHGSISVTGNSVSNRSVGKDYITYDVIEGQSVMVKALPNEGYHFEEFQITDNTGKDVTSKLKITKTEQSIEFTMPNWEVKLAASFAAGEPKEENDSTLAKSNITSKADTSTTSKTTTKKSLDFDTDNLNDYTDVTTVDPADIAILTDKGVSLMRVGEQGVSSGAHLSVSVKADKTTGGTYNSETMKYEGERTPGIYKYPDVITYNIIVKNYGDTDLHYVKVTDTISEELKNSVNVGTIKFDLQKGYYVTTDTGEQIFVSVDGDSGSSRNNTPSTSDTSSDSNTSYSAGALAKSLTIDKIQAGKSVNLKLTMTARKDIKRALNLKNSVNVTASVIETANDNSGTAGGGNDNGGTTEGKGDTSTEKKNDTTEEKSDNTTENTSNATDVTKGALTQATSAEDNTTKGGNSNAGNTANNTSKIVALPVDEAMHNDTEIISIGKYAVHYPQMSVSMTADKTNTGTTNKDGVIGIGKTAGIYKSGDLAKFTITVKNEGNVALHDVTLSDAVSDALKAVLLTGTDGYYFDKTATITDSTGQESTANVTTSGQNLAVLSQLNSGATAKLTFLAKIKSDAKEAKQLVNKVSLTAKWANVENGTTQYEVVESDLAKHTAEDVINVVGTPKMAVGLLANKTTGVTFNNGKYEGTKIAGNYVAGDSVEYKVTVSNLGGTTLYNLKLTGTPSVDLQKALNNDVTFSNVGTATTTAGNEVKVTSVANNIVSLDKLNAGDSITLTIKGTVKRNASMFFGAECSVKLEAQYDDLAKYPSQNLVALTADSDSDKINVPGNPSGTISLTADKVDNTSNDATADVVGIAYKPGDTVKYTLTIKNTGTCDLKNVLLKGTLDNRYAKVSGSNTFIQAKTLTSTNGKAVKFEKKGTSLAQIDTLGVGDSVSIPFSVTLKKDCGNQFRLANKVVMLPYYSIGGNALASTDSSFAETEINVVGDGSVSVGILANKTKGKKLNEKTGRYEGTATEGTYQTGDEVDYTVTVTNTGKSDLYNVRLEDVLSDKLKEMVEEDAGFVIPETGEVTTKNGKVVTIGNAEVSYNENYKAKYENDSILAQEENSTGSTTTTQSTQATTSTTTEQTSTEKSTQATENTESTETTESEKTTESTTVGGALIVNAAEASTQSSGSTTLTTDSDLLNKAFNGNGTTTSLDNTGSGNGSTGTIGGNGSTGTTTGTDSTLAQGVTTASTDEPFSVQLVSSGTDNGESGQVLTLAQLPANDSVQLHFKVKLNSKATTAKGLENTVKVTASKLSANTTLEALKSDKTMEDSDKISVESSASLRIAKLADKTKGVTLKDGRYEGTKVTAKYGPDSTVKYKITVTNLGSNTATNLLVTEEPSEQLKEISKWGKFSQGSSVKTKNGKTVKVTVDGVTAVIDKLASKDSLELEFDVKLKKDATNAVNLNNSVSISGNYVVNGQEVAMTTTDLMSDKDAISIDKTVKPSGNEKKKNKNGKNGKNGKGTDSSKNGANGKGKTSNGTKTGDNSPIGLLLAIMVVCAGTAVVTVLFRRKER
ncbi:InlB B-repeat-containing protein [Anaerobutyricum hallii]|uniref:InlB B-repeat-containing protein n=1 Tax=Anaerobutyricum hallii TaxID=39488 RepID=UPI0035219EA2